MDIEIIFTQQSRVWLSDSTLYASSDSYVQYLEGRGYSLSSIRNYLSCVAHFAHWLKKRRIKLQQIDETLVNLFLDKHLPLCDCAARMQRCRYQVRAALKHLLVVLRLNLKILPQTDTTPAPIQEEIRRFDAHLDQVCGLAAATRKRSMGIVQVFLMERFSDKPIDIAQLKPKDISLFVVNHVKGCKPSTGKIIGGALRRYFRFRGMHGDCTQCLIAAIPSIAEWRLTRLPDVLSDDELAQFLNAFDRQTSTGRRDYAMGRCLVDLGLRACEVAQLQLNDINWREGTLRLRANKMRREDVLLLPSQTGCAIVEYLTNGRPPSTSRALFLRHVAPTNELIGASVVRFAVRRAYAKCGWSQRLMGTHILRHSVASRLLRVGTPMKEIADILRHISLNTTAIYTKVDVGKLAGIAMPWPGSKS